LPNTAIKILEITSKSDCDGYIKPVGNPFCAISAKCNYQASNIWDVGQEQCKRVEKGLPSRCVSIDILNSVKLIYTFSIFENQGRAMSV